MSGVSNILVGSSKRIGDLRIYIGKVARNDANVLISGDTGTGKERVAECIHLASSRHAKPFICVNCAAIPDALLESELFGYERGAFTGAEDAYAGKLRLASGGTVFLDEIGEMSLTAQAKILRVIESREVFALGARRTSPLDVRFIAATNQDLEGSGAAHRFRRDLYYRLNVARIHLPPLKEHTEDILDLLGHFIGMFNQRYGARVGNPDEDLAKCLLRYSWPGNIRELRNLVEAIFIDPPEGPIALEHVPDPFHGIFAEYVTDGIAEREKLLTVLRQTKWNKKRAAVEMKWSRMTLYRKLNKYRIAGE
jgi:two-component system response regulator HydG